MALTPGTRLGHYNAPLSHDTTLDRDVALKVLPLSQSDY